MSAIITLALIAFCLSLGLMQHQWETTLPYWTKHMTPRQEYILGAFVVGVPLLIGIGWAVWQHVTKIPLF